MAKISFVFALTFFLASCFGPVKELKYQIEDSFDDTTSFIENPNPISEDFTNSFPINVLWNGSFSDKTSRNLKIGYAGQHIFYASADGQIKALNIESHDINWSYNHNKIITSGLEVSNQKIYFVDYFYL